MKKLMRLFAAILAIIMLISVQVCAAEVEPRASSYFRSYDAYLHRTSSTTFEVWFDVVADRIMVELGASKIKVQRSTDGTNWATVRTYTKSMYPQLVCSNTFTHADCVSYTMEPGFYYRAYVEFYAKDTSGSAYLYCYTERL